MKVAGVIVAGLAAWMAVPWADMARRGTLDQQAVASWRAEPSRPQAAPSVVVPAQRTSVEVAPLSA